MPFAGIHRWLSIAAFGALAGCSWLVPLDGIFCDENEGDLCAKRDAGAPPRGDGSSMDLELYYATSEADVKSRRIRAELTIVNGGAVDVALSSIEVRYHFSADGLAPVFECVYVAKTSPPFDCGHVRGTFQRHPNPSSTANHYLSLRFGPEAGSLQAFGGATEPIKASIFPETGDFDQSNDHSFDPMATTARLNPRITVYRDGALVFGVEP